MPQLAKNKSDLYFLMSLLLLALGRVLVTDSIGCPEHFDCNSYIRMTSDLTPGTDLPGHHGMRVFPIFLVRLWMMFGLSVEHSFHVLSGACYVTFGMGCYWFIQKITQNKLYAFSWSLILLSLHEAMRIPLYLVYQSNDALIYPIGLGLLIATYYKKFPWVMVLAIIGILTRQNMFVLSFLSLMYLAKAQKNYHAGIGLALVTVMYFLLQNYYGANEVMGELLAPPSTFYTLDGQLSILKTSQFLELWVALIPFILFGLVRVLNFFKSHWHWLLYAGITTFQPYVGFHLTGNNLPRLALQGVWVVALALSLTGKSNQSKAQLMLLCAYAIGIYSTWGVSQRLIIVAAYLIMSGLIWLFQHRGASKIS